MQIKVNYRKLTYLKVIIYFNHIVIHPQIVELLDKIICEPI